MVRVLGCSSERVPIPDLHDVIYYKQIKEYTDAEYESSRDLKKALEKGKLTRLETLPSMRSAESVKASVSGVAISDIKTALREVLPEIKASAPDLKGVARELAPIVADIVRQEISRMAAGTVSHATVPVFQGPEYVPTVSSEGMVSNVEAKKTEASGDAAEDALSALRKLQGIK